MKTIFQFLMYLLSIILITSAHAHAPAMDDEDSSSKDITRNIQKARELWQQLNNSVLNDSRITSPQLRQRRSKTPTPQRCSSTLETNLTTPQTIKCNFQLEPTPVNVFCNSGQPLKIDLQLTGSGTLVMERSSEEDNCCSAMGCLIDLVSRSDLTIMTREEAVLAIKEIEYFEPNMNKYQGQVISTRIGQRLLEQYQAKNCRKKRAPTREFLNVLNQLLDVENKKTFSIGEENLFLIVYEKEVEGFAEALATHFEYSNLLKGIFLSTDLEDGTSRNLSDKDISALCWALERNNGVETLSLAKSNIGDEAVCYISRLLQRNRTLTNLDLNSTQIAAFGMCSLAKSLSQNSTLLTLNFNQCPSLKSAGIKFLCQDPRSISHLTTLEISGCLIQDKGAEYLSTAMAKNASITSLNLPNNEIGQKGGIALGKMLAENATLKTLTVSYNEIDDEGGEAIGKGLMDNKGLLELNLEFNDIFFKGMSSIARALKSNQTLHILKLKAQGNNQLISGRVIFDMVNNLENNVGLIELNVGSIEKGADKDQAVERLSRILSTSNNTLKKTDIHEGSASEKWINTMLNDPLRYQLKSSGKK